MRSEHAHLTFGRNQTLAVKQQALARAVTASLRRELRRWFRRLARAARR